VKDLLQQFDEFLPRKLGIILDDVVVDEPSLELAIAPSTPDIIGDIVIIFRHLVKKSIASLLEVRLDDIVIDKPLMLQDSDEHTRIGEIVAAHHV
jgi:hypothetical protein